ncbi:MAG: putative aspartyl protease [Gammaproteobacteria bacterium]|nr:putative aspartyl protease [Gammaproteobacteria bacterium]
MSEKKPDSGNYSQRVGKTMIIMAWIVLLGLLSWLFSIYLERQHNPNEQVLGYSSNGVQEVILERNRYGHYVATGSINGQSVTFMLDTGATIVDIPDNLASTLSLVRGPSFEAMTANGVISVYSTILDEVQLGGIRLTGVRASINPSRQEDDVLLGMSFLRQLDFSQQGDRLTLRQRGEP